jgi:putative membrane protein
VKLHTALTLLAVVSLTTPAIAAGTATNKLVDSDKAFMLDCAQSGMTEVKLGELAEKNASDTRIKNFAQRIVADHSKANHNLESIASRKGVKLPAQIDAEHQAVIDKFDKLSGNQFDKPFMEQMVKDHKAVASKLESKVSDADVQDWAKETLPTVKEHLQMSEEINNSIGTKASR